MTGPGPAGDVRIGIVSDVHGNTAGLATALDRMGPVDGLLCAGDIVEEFRFSNESVELLRDSGAHCVLGNHDLGLLSDHGVRARSAPGVRADLVEWLAALPRTLTLTLAGTRILMTHASPCAPHTQYVLAGSPELRRIAEVDADVVVIGHTHAQLLSRVGATLVINPGSVGQARHHANGKRLSYAVLHLDPSGATGERVEFDDYMTDNTTAHTTAARGEGQPTAHAGAHRSAVPSGTGVGRT